MEGFFFSPCRLIGDKIKQGDLDISEIFSLVKLGSLTLSHLATGWPVSNNWFHNVASSFCLQGKSGSFA